MSGRSRGNPARPVARRCVGVGDVFLIEHDKPQRVLRVAWLASDPAIDEEVAGDDLDRLVRQADESLDVILPGIWPDRERRSRPSVVGRAAPARRAHLCTSTRSPALGVVSSSVGIRRNWQFGHMISLGRMKPVSVEEVLCRGAKLYSQPHAGQTRVACVPTRESAIDPVGMMKGINQKRRGR